MKKLSSFPSEPVLSTPVDLLIRQMADAPFTPQQFSLWQDICAELVTARLRLQELETRLKILERQPQPDEESGSVLNRPEFNREVARMLAFDERYGGISSVLYFDIENLDLLTQSIGKERAAKAVRCVCDTLLRHIRRSDIVGRLAPDEFGVLLPRCDNDAAWKKGESMAAAVADALTALGEADAAPGVTYGAYTFREKEDLAVGLKQAASSMTKLVRQ